MAVLVYAVNSQFDRAEMILNIDAYHPQDWVQLLEDHVMNKAVTRIRVMQMAGQDTSGSGEASTSTTQQCSTGYSKSPDSCCLDYSFSWKAMAANAVQLVLGTFSILVDGKYGWCEFVTSAMELTVQSTKRDLPAPLSKRTVPRPICENHFGTPHPAACFDALTDMDFFEDITDGAEYDIAQQQILEFLAPYASPRFPQYRSAQTPRAWAFGEFIHLKHSHAPFESNASTPDECEVAVMWRWNGRPYSDLATEKQVSDGGAQVVRSCVLWGSGGYQVVGS